MLNVELLRQCFLYWPDTGRIYWRQRPREHFPSEKEWKRWNTRYALTPAGQVDAESGYLLIKVARMNLKGHRVAWALAHGQDPAELEIDHINGRKDDNRLENLRLVTHQQNSCNRSLRSDNRSGVPGVSWNERQQLWFVRVVRDGCRRYIGRCAKLEDAIAMRNRAAERCGYHENHGRVTA